MRGVFLGRIKFAVRHACAGAHPLNIPLADDRTCPHAIFMLKLPLNNKRDNLHVAVRVRRKTHPRLDKILVDHPQRAKMSVCRVLIVAKGKRVVGFKPTKIKVTAFGRFSKLDQISRPKLWQPGSISKKAWIRFIISGIVLTFSST